MATRNIGTGNKKSPGRKKPTSPDTLVKGGKSGNPELREDELRDITGGTVPLEYKI